MLTSTDLQAYINTHHISAEIIRPPTATPTVSDAALAMGVHPDAIIKSVLFIIRRSDPLLVIANGERQISQRAIADRLGVGKKQVRDYSEREVTFIKVMWFYYRKGLSPKNAHKSAREELAKSSSSVLSPLNDHRDDHQIPEREADSLEGIAIFELPIPLKSYFHVKMGDQKRRWALAT